MGSGVEARSSFDASASTTSQRESQKPFLMAKPVYIHLLAPSTNSMPPLSAKLSWRVYRPGQVAKSLLMKWF